MEYKYENNSYAGFWMRFFAYLIDIIILQVATSIVYFANTLRQMRVSFDDIDLDLYGNISVGENISIGLFALLYFSIMESSKLQATLGKMALGIKVVDLNGQRISFVNALGRYFGKILSGIIFLIGYIMAAFTKKKQALHDILAGTLVIKE